MNKGYKNVALRQLRDQQIKYAPRDRKLDQANRAETLISEIDPNKQYPVDYIYYRLTDFRPEQPSVGSLLPGKSAAEDLRLMVEDLSDAADVSVDTVPEEVLTVEQLSDRFNVSTKTISRWRKQGLVSRKFLFEGRKRVGFLRSSVERFVKDNPDRIERGRHFSQLTEAEKLEIIDRARRLASAGGTPSEVAKRVAAKMGRSVETIRYTLKHHDDEQPKEAVFPRGTGPLTESAKQIIYGEYRHGVSVDRLSEKHGRTRASIYRVINEIRFRHITELPLDCIYNEDFEKPELEEDILGEMPPHEKAARKVRVPAGLPTYLASLYEMPLLTREQEYHLFRKFNFLKNKALKIRETLDEQRPKSSDMDAIEQLYDQASDVKNLIVQSNLRLVVSIAKRHVAVTEDFFELVSDGNMSLIRAAEKFDYSRGNKFSTYCSWAIMKNFARTIPVEFRHRDRYRTSLDEYFTTRVDERSDQYEQEMAQQTREKQIDKILHRLDEREQKIIIRRFGLDHSREPQTLKEVGEELGVTKERIRQIEARALNKLKTAARDYNFDLPETN
ncbi:sigma-70 family RNA polymerase sigma factor [Bremerella alba]|uniref:RNA polymerase sigma factor RpoD n=1 Tax=Bremerella alba TaxID=980252 RepID=A0A7V8V3X6_9BACT|nr:sigma-70 family RNA polymerase sigma factor [Bremerella alba]MBA2114477.1 RNA polymerase sigma factor RpoD [Bremerella alba]